MSAKLSLVGVLWSDAHGNAFAIYEQHELPHAPAAVTTYGLLLRHDDTGLTIANEAFEAGSFRGVTFIPAGMITAVTHYAPARQKRPAKTPSAPHSPDRASP